MRIAVIGSRTIKEIDLSRYISAEDEIVSGGAVGVDRCAADYAKANGLLLTEFLPQYECYGRAAPHIRNREIVDYAEKIIAFWDGKSKGTKSVIQYAKQRGKLCEVILCMDKKTDGE